MSARPSMALYARDDTRNVWVRLVGFQTLVNHQGIWSLEHPKLCATDAL